jgi:hypothetical protein
MFTIASSLRRRGLSLARRAAQGDAGMATAEYAVATVGACGLGGILIKLLTSDGVMQLLFDLIKKALGFAL